MPENTEALYLFLKPEAWRLPPAQFCQGLIDVGEVMSPAIEIVIDSHIATNAPIIIEGDGILSSLFARSLVQKHVQSGQVRGVFLVEPDEESMYTNILARGRGTERMSEAELRTEARAKLLYGRWLAEQASHCNIPVLEPRPWETPVERVLQIVSW